MTLVLWIVGYLVLGIVSACIWAVLAMRIAYECDRTLILSDDGRHEALLWEFFFGVKNDSDYLMRYIRSNPKTACRTAATNLVLWPLTILLLTIGKETGLKAWKEFLTKNIPE